MKKKTIELRATPVDKNFFTSTKKEKQQFINDVFKFLEIHNTNNDIKRKQKEREVLISKELARHLQTIREKQKVIVFVTPYTTNITLDLVEDEESDYPHDKRCEGTMCWCAKRAQKENPEKWKRYKEQNHLNLPVQPLLPDLIKRIRVHNKHKQRRTK
jgi:hypothetical protein